MIYRLMVLKTDGTQMQWTGENTTTITDPNATAARPTPPKTEEQLIAVALNPQLTINYQPGQRNRLIHRRMVHKGCGEGPRLGTAGALTDGEGLQAEPSQTA